jgi:nucleotide-binding universal stress UspA family protein
MAGGFARILLASEHTDFDSGAETVALALAQRSGLPLHAVLPMLSNPEFEMAAPQLAERADEQAARSRQALQGLADAAGVTLQLRVRRGAEPFAEIVQAARELPADLIVLRRRGKRSFLANLLVGEMVGKVLAHADCSVLLAPRGAQLWRRAVLVGLDPLAPDAGLLAQAVAMAADHRLPLHVVCVAASVDTRPTAQQALAAALLQAGQSNVPVQGEVRIGRAHQEVLAAAEAHGADLIVLARHGPHNLGRAWIGGVAQKVIGLAECPVLVHINSNSSPS